MPDSTSLLMQSAAADTPRLIVSVGQQDHNRLVGSLARFLLNAMCVLAFEFAGSQKCLVKAGKTAGLKLKIAGYLACRDKDVIDVALVVGALHAAAIAKVMNRDIGTKGHKGHIDDSCRKRVVGDVLAKVVQTRIDGLHDPIDGPGAVGNDNDAAARLGQTTAAKRIQKIGLVGVAGIRGKNFCLDEIVQVVDTIIAGHRRFPFSLEASFGLLLALHYGLVGAAFWGNRSAESQAQAVKARQAYER